MITATHNVFDAVIDEAENNEGLPVNRYGRLLAIPLQPEEAELVPMVRYILVKSLIKRRWIGLQRLIRFFIIGI